MGIVKSRLANRQCNKVRTFPLGNSQSSPNGKKISESLDIYKSSAEIACCFRKRDTFKFS